MRRRGPLIPQLDRLENRLCPSASPTVPSVAVLSLESPAEQGVMTVEDPVDEMDGADSGMYDWIMMVMTPEQMMAQVNEYDQSAKVPAAQSPGKADDSMKSGMTTSGGTTQSVIAPVMSAGEMAPAQMMMEPEPLVRPGSRSSGRAPMMDEMEANEKADDQDSKRESMPPEEPDEGGPAQPPRLDPGKLDPRLSPELEAQPIDPFLEIPDSSADTAESPVAMPL